MDIKTVLAVVSLINPRRLRPRAMTRLKITMAQQSRPLEYSVLPSGVLCIQIGDDIAGEHYAIHIRDGSATIIDCRDNFYERKFDTGVTQNAARAKLEVIIMLADLSPASDPDAAQAPAFSWTSASVLHDDILCVQIVIDGGRPRYIGDHATLKRYITELVLNNYDAEVLQRMYRYVAEEVAVVETKNAALRDIFGSDGDAF